MITLQVTPLEAIYLILIGVASGIVAWLGVRGDDNDS